MNSPFKHRTPLELRFADMDAMGHVNNAKYFTYFEEARIKYLDHVLGSDIRYAEKGVIVASAKADFKFPVLFRDEMLLLTRCARIGTKSFEITYSLIKLENTKELEAASGSTVMVCFDYEKNVSIEIPELWKTKLKAFEGI